MEETVPCRQCKKQCSPNKHETTNRCSGYKCPIGEHGQSSHNQRQCCRLSESRFLQFFRNFGPRFHKNSGSGSNKQVSNSLNVEDVTGFIEAHPRKRALLCGVTYNRWKYRLKRTINDVQSMRELLIQKYGYHEACIRVLTEDEPEKYTPTKKNIQFYLKWLVDGSKSGDTLVFYFSGHGLRQPDFNNDERDGFDETICPVDFMQEGMILDNEINSTIVWPLEKGVTLHAIVDACHSGTILDLEYVYNRDRNVWEDNSAPSKARKSTSGGLAICLSACNDDQMAADTTAFTGNKMAGAMTFVMIETIFNVPDVTYGGLVNNMHEMVEQFNNKSCLSCKFIPKAFHHRQIQDALLSSSEKFDVNKTKFML